VRWGENQHGRTTAALASAEAWAFDISGETRAACKIRHLSGNEKSEVQLRRVRVHLRAHAAAAHHHSGSSHECLCDIDVFFSRRFEERPSEFIGQRLSFFIRDLPPINQITLVPDENNAVLQQ
jgi:hypothetical protein